MTSSDSIERTTAAEEPVDVAAIMRQVRRQIAERHGLQADSDRDGGPEWAVGVDSTVVRAHRHAAGARHDPPKDVPAEKLAPLLPAPPRHTGG